MALDHFVSQVHLRNFCDPVSLSAALDAGAIVVRIDEKFPQALLIENLLKTIAVFGNCDWEIVRNPGGRSRFFTSDFPAAAQPSLRPIDFARIVPLAPDLAIRIYPKIQAKIPDPDFKFPHFSMKDTMATEAIVREFNQAIVRCAGDVVFYPDDRPWVRGFVERHRHFRIETSTRTEARDGGYLSVFNTAVLERRPAGSSH